MWQVIREIWKISQFQYCSGGGGTNVIKSIIITHKSLQPSIIPPFMALSAFSLSLSSHHINFNRRAYNFFNALSSEIHAIFFQSLEEMEIQA